LFTYKFSPNLYASLIASWIKRQGAAEKNRTHLIIHFLLRHSTVRAVLGVYAQMYTA